MVLLTSVRRAVAASAVALLALAGPVGCGEASPSDRARPAPLHPLNGAAYYSDAEQRTMDEKVEAATGDCMRRRGFHYPAEPTPPATAPVESEPGNPYGLLDARDARTRGYGIVPEEMRRRQGGPSATPSSPDPRYAAALLGDQTRQRTLPLPDGNEVSIAVGACVTEARAAVFGDDWDRLFYTVQALSNMVITRTGDSPEVARALETWSSCVGRAGHPAAHPEELREALYERARAAADAEAVRAVARAELATAEADADCQEQAGLRQALRDAQRRVEQQVLTDGFRRDVEQLRQRRQRVLG
ncbi:hypothetical protein ACFYUR_29010 [Micromonospora haikouensis]|uniref:hypothetical protein n=1 Tax=Micromonospora haikouensis TaxID=686309 RepID=UPI0036878CD3